MMKIFNKIKDTKLYQFIYKIISFDNKYNLTIMSLALSFNTLVSLVSLFIILIQIINYRYDIMDSMLITKILSIFSSEFSIVLKEILPKFEINNFTSLIVITLFWSASCTVNAYNKIADKIYIEIKKRNSILLRISSLLMFLMIFVIVLFEIIFILMSNKIIEKHFDFFIGRLIKMLIEYLSIFLLLLIVYSYVPPEKMTFKKVCGGSSLISILIYILIYLYLIIIKILQSININMTITFLLNSILLFIFIINYLVILGIIINYNKNNSNKNKK